MRVAKCKAHACSQREQDPGPTRGGHRGPKGGGESPADAKATQRGGFVGDGGKEHTAAAQPPSQTHGGPTGRGPHHQSRTPMRAGAPAEGTPPVGTRRQGCCTRFRETAGALVFGGPSRMPLLGRQCEGGGKEERSRGEPSYARTRAPPPPPAAAPHAPPPPPPTPHAALAGPRCPTSQTRVQSQGGGRPGRRRRCTARGPGVARPARGTPATPERGHRRAPHTTIHAATRGHRGPRGPSGRATGHDKPVKAPRRHSAARAAPAGRPAACGARHRAVRRRRCAHRRPRRPVCATASPGAPQVDAPTHELAPHVEGAPRGRPKLALEGREQIGGICEDEPTALCATKRANATRFASCGDQ